MLPLNVKNNLQCEGGIEKSIPRNTVLHHQVSDDKLDPFYLMLLRQVFVCLFAWVKVKNF